MSTESKKFDLHCHTFHSDGVNSPIEMLETANKLGLDYIAITDHNTVDGVIELIESGALADSDTKVVPGVELSFLWGHYVILGVEPYEYKNQMENQWGLVKGSFAAPAFQSTIDQYLEWSIENQNTYNLCAHPGLPTIVMSTPLSTLADLFKRGLVHGAENHNHDVQRHFSLIYSHYQYELDKALSSLNIPKFANSDAHYKEYLGIMVEQNNTSPDFLNWINQYSPAHT